MLPVGSAATPEAGRCLSVQSLAPQRPGGNRHLSSKYRIVIALPENANGGVAPAVPSCVPGMALILEVQVLYGPAGRNR